MILAHVASHAQLIMLPWDFEACSYGKSLFLPFSDNEMLFNGMLMADSAYIFPFLLFVVIGSYLYRGNQCNLLCRNDYHY